MAETLKALHLVPVEQMTDAELQAKAAELEAMAERRAAKLANRAA